MSEGGGIVCVCGGGNWVKAVLSLLFANTKESSLAVNWDYIDIHMQSAYCYLYYRPTQNMPTAFRPHKPKKVT